MVGEKTAKLLEVKFKTLDKFKLATLTTLLSIQDMGNVVSNNIVEWLSLNENQALLDELVSLNIGNTIEEILILEHKLDGLKIAFTGKLQNWTRDQCKKLILSNGGIPWDIKKDISVLLIGDGAKDAKIEKAKKLGAKIVTEVEFLDMIK